MPRSSNAETAPARPSRHSVWVVRCAWSYERAISSGALHPAPMPMTTFAPGNSSASRARHAWPSLRGSGDAAATTTTSDSRAETMASGARVVMKCSIDSLTRCRSGSASAERDGESSKAMAITWCSRAAS